MYRSARNNSDGFSLVELLVGAGIIVSIAAMTTYGLNAYRSKQALDNADTSLVSILQEARSRTLAGINAQQYGVHLSAGKAELFSGSYYVAPSVVTSVSFDQGVTLSTISLSSGLSDIVFTRGTGETPSYGTLILTNASGKGTKTVTVSESGLVSD